ncbi:6180_t:CDS:2, partial [Gigaspora rosea]
MGVSKTTIFRSLAELNKMGKLTLSKQGQKSPQDFPEEYINAKLFQILLSQDRKKWLKKAKDYWDIVNTELIEDDDNDESFNFSDTE